MSTMNKKVVAIDAGKFNLKGKSDIGELLFKTKYSFGHTDTDMLGVNTFNIIFEGEEYTIGNNATYSDKNEGKDTKVHIMCTLSAIALLSGGAEEIILMYGESFNKYMNADHKRRLKAKLEGRHTIIVDGKAYTFNITLCHILPEGMGHILSNLKAYQGVQYTLDWGGTTVNFIKSINGRPDTEVSKSFHLGMHNICAIATDKIDKAGIGKFDNDLVDQWIKEGCKDIRIQKIINIVIKEQLLKIDDKLSGFGINLHDYLEVTFIGGTSDQFQSQIKEHYACARLYSDPLRANVNGFYEYGRVKYGN